MLKLQTRSSCCSSTVLDLITCWFCLLSWSTWFHSDFCDCLSIESLTGGVASCSFWFNVYDNIQNIHDWILFKWASVFVPESTLPADTTVFIRGGTGLLPGSVLQTCMQLNRFLTAQEANIYGQQVTCVTLKTSITQHPYGVSRVQPGLCITRHTKFSFLHRSGRKEMLLLTSARVSLLSALFSLLSLSVMLSPSLSLDCICRVMERFSGRKSDRGEQRWRCCEMI